MTEVIAEKLRGAFKRTTGDRVEIANLKRLSAGASCESWAFELSGLQASSSRPMILRRPPSDDPHLEATALMAKFAPARDVEGNLLIALEKAGLPVPPVRLVLEPEDGLGRGFVMDLLPGAPMPHRILDDPDYRRACRHLPPEIAKFRADLNHAKTAARDLLPEQCIDQQLTLFRDIIEALGIANPGIEFGMAWLADNRPKTGGRALVHGDFRLSNWLVTTDGLSAVIDWELAHIGDPLEDLGWLCVRSWRFSRPDRPAAGLTDRRTLLRAYRAVGGGDVSLADLLFWEVLGNVKWSLICLVQGNRYLQGDDRSIELAAIGRRAEEPIYDMLKLIDGKDGTEPML